MVWKEGAMAEVAPRFVVVLTAIARCS